MQKASWNQQIVIVSTNNISKLGSHTASVSIASTYSGTTFTTTWSFNVNIVDPCASTTINSWVIGARSVRDGETDTYEFTEATDSIQVSNNVNTLCGPREYTVLNSDGTVPTNGWIVVAAKTGTAYPNGVY